jgi:hypothetical protein
MYIPTDKIKTELKKIDIPVKLQKINFLDRPCLFMSFIILSKLLSGQTKRHSYNKHNTNL